MIYIKMHGDRPTFATADIDEIADAYINDSAIHAEIHVWEKDVCLLEVGMSAKERKMREDNFKEHLEHWIERARIEKIRYPGMKTLRLSVETTISI